MRSKRRIIEAAALVGFLLLVLIFWRLDLERLGRQADQLNGWMVFLLMAALPLVGFPVSVVYAVGGARFGHDWGLLAAAGAIVVHLAGSWIIAHSWLKAPLNALFAKLKFRMPRIPSNECVPVCLLIALVPGVSYTLKNYFMVLGEAPFRPYFFTCLPAHFIHATLAILFGDFVTSMTPGKILFLVAYGILLIGLSHYVVERLRKRASVEIIQ